MKLETATIENYVLNDKDIGKEAFPRLLLASHDILADVYLDGKLARTSKVTFSDISGWLVAHIGGLFSIDEGQHINYLLIRMYQAGYKDTIIASSNTRINTDVESSDQELNLHLAVCSLYNGFNRLRSLPDSSIRQLRESRINKINLSAQPSVSDNIILVDDDGNPINQASYTELLNRITSLEQAVANLGTMPSGLDNLDEIIAKVEALGDITSLLNKIEAVETKLNAYSDVEITLSDGTNTTTKYLLGKD